MAWSISCPRIQKGWIHQLLNNPVHLYGHFSTRGMDQTIDFIRVVGAVKWQDKQGLLCSSSQWQNCYTTSLASPARNYFQCISYPKACLHSALLRHYPYSGAPYLRENGKPSYAWLWRQRTPTRKYSKYIGVLVCLCLTNTVICLCLINTPLGH